MPTDRSSEPVAIKFEHELKLILQGKERELCSSNLFTHLTIKMSNN